jgi:hypothetical protein
MTFSELQIEFKNIQTYFQENLYNEIYIKIEEKNKVTSSRNTEAMMWITKYLERQIYKRLNFKLTDLDLEWKEVFFYGLTSEEKLDRIKVRVEELKTFFQQNKNNILQPSRFLETISDPQFPIDLYENLSNSTKKEIIAEIYDNDDEFSDTPNIFLYLKDVISDFGLLSDNIIEFMYLKVLVEEIQPTAIDKRKIDSTKFSITEINDYPEIFTSIDAYNLFNYTVGGLKKNEEIGPALATKLLEYFKDEKKILKNVRKGHYINFLNKKHHLLFKKLDDRTAPNDHDLEVFNNIKENFELEAIK